MYGGAQPPESHRHGLTNGSTTTITTETLTTSPKPHGDTKWHLTQRNIRYERTLTRSPMPNSKTNRHLTKENKKHDKKIVNTSLNDESFTTLIDLTDPRLVNNSQALHTCALTTWQGTHSRHALTLWRRTHRKHALTPCHQTLTQRLLNQRPRQLQQLRVRLT